MSAIDISVLENLVMVEDPPSSGVYREMIFQEFKDLHTSGQNRANTYYTALELEAYDNGLLHVENYAILARDVVNNSSINGQIANNFTNTYAEAAMVDFSPGSDARLRLQFELMLADFGVRRDDVNNSGTGELSFQDTIDIHTDALGEIGLPSEAFSLYTPLTILAEHDPARAQFLFQTSIAEALFALSMDFIQWRRPVRGEPRIFPALAASRDSSADISWPRH